MRGRRSIPRVLAVAGVAAGGAILLGASHLIGNHPVYVEGNCPGPAARAIVVVPNTCGDYDGDGRIGIAEDNDEPDRIFGTINAALGPGLFGAIGTGANQNGSVTIVRSGIFPEIVTITAANGNVTLQAAPGVEAIIDAVLQGDATPPGNVGRQNAPGIIVNAPEDRYVVIRNLTSRNWTSGIAVLGASHAAIENVRLENNVNFGLEVRDRARVTIAKSEVHGTGLRVGGGVPDFPRAADPMPGSGIDFSGESIGTVFFTTVSGSFRAGIANRGSGHVCVSHVNAFDNNPNFFRIPRHENVDSNRCDTDRP
jgi:hypothetical protein